MSYVAMRYQVERRHAGDIWHLVGMPHGELSGAVGYGNELLADNPKLTAAELRVALTTVEVVFQFDQGNSDITD